MNLLTTETLEIPGPYIGGKPRAARITIKRNRVTARVSWDVGGIDVNGAASDAFGRRLEAAGMHQALHRWLKERVASMKPRPWWQGGVRWGHVRGIPVGLASDLAEMVAGFYRAAVVDLPLR